MALPLVGRMLYQSAALFSAQLFSFIKMQDIYSLSKIKIFIADVREEIIKYLDGTQTLMNYKVACEVVFINQQFNGCLVQYQEVLGQWNEDAIKLIDYSLVKGRRQSEDAQKFSQHFFNFNEVFLKIFQSVLSLAENSPGIATRKLESIFIKIKIILNDFENKISSVAVNKNVSSLYSFKKINNYFQVNELTCNASFLVQARNINGDFKFQQIELAIIYFCDILSKYINSIKDSRRIKNESNVALSDISYELILAVQLNNELIQKREFFLKNALELSFSCSQSLFNGPRVSNMEYSSYLSDVIDFIKKLYFLEKDILFSAKAIIIFPGHYQHDKQRLIRIIKHHINILDLWQEKIPFKLWQGEWLFPSIRNNNFNQRPNNNWRQIDSSLDCQDFKGANEWNVSEGMAVLPGLTLTPSWPSQNLSSENVEIKVDAEEKSLYFEQQKAQKLWIVGPRAGYLDQRR